MDLSILEVGPLLLVGAAWLLIAIDGYHEARHRLPDQETPFQSTEALTRPGGSPSAQTGKARASTPVGTPVQVRLKGRRRLRCQAVSDAKGQVKTCIQRIDAAGRALPYPVRWSTDTPLQAARQLATPRRRWRNWPFVG